MINLAIAYDDNDDLLGDYFEECFNTINRSIDNQIIDLSPIRGLDCSEENVNAITNRLTPPIIFVALSHGNDDMLITDEAFVSANNVDKFQESFFYSTACCAGNILGPLLINRGTQCFIGYTDFSYASEEDYNQTYIDCEIYSLKEFLTTGKTISETYIEMLRYFDDKIDEMFNLNEINVAIELQLNKDSLICMGNPGLTRNDFVIK